MLILNPHQDWAFGDLRIGPEVMTRPRYATPGFYDWQTG